MKMKIVLILSMFLAGCSDYIVCVDGEMYENVNPFSIGDTYQPLNAACIVKE